MSANTLVLVAALLFVITHLGISSTALRGVLAKGLGDRGFMGLYSMLAFASLGFLVYAYAGSPHTAFVYGPSIALNWIAVVVMPFAIMLLVGGVTVRNPSAVMQDQSVHDPDVVHGFLRITRHPVQMAIFLWAIAHLAANGDLASVWFFGGLGLVSGLGMWLMDRKKAAALGEDWRRFAMQTSVIPFGAIVAGRNRLVFSEIWIPIVVGFALWIVLLWAHTWIGGVPIML